VSLNSRLERNEEEEEVHIEGDIEGESEEGGIEREG